MVLKVFLMIFIKIIREKYWKTHMLKYYVSKPLEDGSLTKFNHKLQSI